MTDSQPEPHGVGLYLAVSHPFPAGRQLVEPRVFLTPLIEHIPNPTNSSPKPSAFKKWYTHEFGIVTVGRGVAIGGICSIVLIATFLPENEGIQPHISKCGPGSQYIHNAVKVLLCLMAHTGGPLWFATWRLRVKVGFLAIRSFIPQTQHKVI